MDLVRFLQTSDQDSCTAPLSFDGSTSIIIVFCALGLIWAFFNFTLVRKINLN